MGEFAGYQRDTVAPELWCTFYDKLEAASRVCDAFPDVEYLSKSAFVSNVYNPDRQYFLLTFRNELAGVVYLTDPNGTSAQIHFAFLPTESSRSASRLAVPIALGRFAVSTLLWSKGGGNYLFDTFMGLTPACNKAAVKMICRCGAVSLGEVPGAFYMHGEPRNIAAVATYFTRESVPEAWKYL